MLRPEFDLEIANRRGEGRLPGLMGFRVTASGLNARMPQNIAEIWAAATRSSAQNGLGLPVAVVAAALDHIERVFALLPDHPAIYDHWKRLVMTHEVVGNRVYDARLVAAMTVHGIGRILTFDAEDFARYGIEVIHPSAVP